MRPICLDHLTLSDLTVLELIGVAQETGCASVSLFVKPLPLGPYRDLVHDKAARSDVVRALRDAGLGVGIVEPFMMDQALDWDETARTVEVAAELGGRVNALGFDAEPQRLQDHMCRLAGLVRAAGVEMAIEAFALSAVPTPAEALRLAEAAGSDVGLCVDTLHVMRAGWTWDQVAALPAERILHVQLNDGPLTPPDDRYREATIARLPPGDGEFGLEEFIPMIPPSATIAVEAPFIAQQGMTPLDRGRIAVDATRRLLDGR